MNYTLTGACVMNGFRYTRTQLVHMGRAFGMHETDTPSARLYATDEAIQRGTRKVREARSYGVEPQSYQELFNEFARRIDGRYGWDMGQTRWGWLHDTYGSYRYRGGAEVTALANTLRKADLMGLVNYGDDRPIALRLFRHGIPVMNINSFSDMGAYVTRLMSLDRTRLELTMGHIQDGHIDMVFTPGTRSGLLTSELVRNASWVTARGEPLLTSTVEAAYGIVPAAPQLRSAVGLTHFNPASKFYCGVATDADIHAPMVQDVNMDHITCLECTRAWATLNHAMQAPPKQEDNSYVVPMRRRQIRL